MNYIEQRLYDAGLDISLSQRIIELADGLNLSYEDCVDRFVILFENTLAKEDEQYFLEGTSGMVPKGFLNNENS